MLIKEDLDFILMIGRWFLVDKEFSQEAGGNKLDTDDHEEHTQKEQGLAVLDSASGDSEVGDVNADEETKEERGEADGAEEVTGAGIISCEEDYGD